MTTVAEAIELVRRVGVVQNAEGHLKLKFPERERAALQPAIDILRSCKLEALALLAEPLKDDNLGRTEPQSLEAVLKGRAIELWSDALGERFWLVADEADAAKLGEPRGTVYSAAEARQVIRIGDPSLVREIHSWKRKFEGRVRELQKGEPGNLGGDIPARLH